MKERAVIYDITDDWTTFTQSQSLTRRIIAQDAELCRRADAVIVCSEKLFELKRDMAQRLYLIPNGVNADHYRPVLDENGPLPAETRGWKKPVLGYTGSIHPDRVDVSLIADIARAMPQATLALVGPNMLPSRGPEAFANAAEHCFHRQHSLSALTTDHARLRRLHRAASRYAVYRKPEPD